MKKIFLLVTILAVSLFAQLTNERLSQKIINEKIPIVDIRTPGEWKEGILAGVVTITFFDEQGNYNVNSFLKELNERVDTTKPFAIICHTGSRTSAIAPWLSQELKYNVINLVGGMDYATNALHLKTYKRMQ